MPVTAARHAARSTLAQVGRGRRLDRAFSEAVAGLPDRDRAWVHEAVYGTVRLRGRLDHLLDHHLHRGVAGVERSLLDVLRLGAYQLLHMGSVPPYAAVSQAVEQARAVSRGKRAGALVNAVLRAVARSGEDPALFPDPDTDLAAHLATWGSHPRWLVDRWLDRWPPEAVRALVEADNAIPPTTLVPLDGAVAEVVERLEEAGIEATPVGRGTPAVELAAGVSPEAALAAVPRAVIQDPGASLVVPFAAPGPGGPVADLCAAPGGKALVLAARSGYVLAADPSRVRLGMVRDAARRAGVRVGCVVARAEAPPLAGAALVLVDAPCTGTGTLRRHPDARWRLRPDDVPAMASLQKAILDGAAGAVAPGGLLVYGTCSLEPEENEEQVEAFLRRRPGFRLAEAGPVGPRYLDRSGRLAVRPWSSGFDGAFAVRLRREAPGEVTGTRAVREDDGSTTPGGSRV